MSTKILFHAINMNKIHKICLLGVGGMLACVALAGCGQKGPLFLPAPPGGAPAATLPQSVLPSNTDNTNHSSDQVAPASGANMEPTTPKSSQKASHP